MTAERRTPSAGKADGVVEMPAGDTPAPGPITEDIAPEAEAGAMVGRRIGAWRLLRELGRGGMGAVYLAIRDDDAYRKQVAIKLVRAGGSSDLLVDRFRQERNILAGLDHPNIARLLDGGATEEGLPYFVMELVEGMPIDEYCDAHALPVQKRLALFRTVCSAVQFAHLNQVVHRDLKPANIFVTADGTPKLLDFGIAKLISPVLTSLGPTATASPLMTPAYASPEQVRNEPIGATSDVYSLGVLLYRLLTGRGPYRLPTGSVPEIYDAIRSQEPARPSAVVARGKTSRPLSRDLDNIVLRALRKEPRERYASVEELSADIGRHLDGLPVRARKATLLYRAGKFFRRHTNGAVTAAAAAAVLAAALAVQTLAGRRAGSTSLPVVVLMDSTLPDRVYDPDTRAQGGTNSDDVTDALQDLPVVIVKEPTSALWHREEQVLRERPALVVMHISSFSRPSHEPGLQPEAEERARSFMAFIGVGNPSTRFLVYTRGFETEEKRAAWISRSEERFPVLRGRVQILSVPGGVERATFRDAAVKKRVRALVAAALSLDPAWQAGASGR